MLSKTTYDLALTCTIFSMALSPLVTGIAEPLGRRWLSWRKTADPEQTIETPAGQLTDHTILGGYGRSGRAVAHVLRAAGVPLCIIELNHSLYLNLTAEGFAGVWGDITSDEVLHGAHATKARILLLTLPDQNTIHLAVKRVRQLNPKTLVIARATRRKNVPELDRLGIEASIQPEFEGGVEMVRQALIRYDYGDAATRDLLNDARRQFYADA